MKASERIIQKSEALRKELVKEIVEQVIRWGGHYTNKEPKEGDVNINPIVVGVRFSGGPERDWYDDFYTEDSLPEFIDTVYPDGTYQMGNEYESNSDFCYKLENASMENLLALLQRMENLIKNEDSELIERTDGAEIEE